jgi:predicted PurR-regulated permease PerM
MATRSAPPSNGEDPDILQHVPVPLQVAGAWAWRLIVVGIVSVALFATVARLSALVVPIAVALLIAAPLGSVVGWLARHRFSRTWAALTTLLTLVATVLGLIALAGATVVSGIDDLKKQASDGLHTLIGWLSSGPLNLSADQIQSYLDKAGQTLQAHSSGIAARAFSVGSTVGLLTAGAILALFCLFFFLKDGRQIWLDVVQMFPRGARAHMDYAGVAAWETLSRYTRTSAFAALVDAAGIGLGAWILGLNLWVPIFIVVFLTAFIPLVGATFSGVVTVLVAVVEGGWVKAVIMVGVVLVVQQVEGNVLYPFLFGKAASVHPIVILLAVGVGGIVGGLVGALLGVPIMAFTNSFIEGLRKTGLGPTTEIPIAGIGAG